MRCHPDGGGGRYRTARRYNPKTAIFKEVFLAAEGPEASGRAVREQGNIIKASAAESGCRLELQAAFALQCRSSLLRQLTFLVCFPAVCIRLSSRQPFVCVPLRSEVLTVLKVSALLLWGTDVTCTCRLVTFRRNALPPSSGPKERGGPHGDAVPRTAIDLRLACAILERSLMKGRRDLGSAVSVWSVPHPLTVPRERMGRWKFLYLPYPSEPLYTHKAALGFMGVVVNNAALTRRFITSQLFLIVSPTKIFMKLWSNFPNHCRPKRGNGRPMTGRGCTCTGVNLRASGIGC